MFGGIPNEEIDGLKKYWDAFPNLKTVLFKSLNSSYSELLSNDDIKELIDNNQDIKAFNEKPRNIPTIIPTIVIIIVSLYT